MSGSTDSPQREERIRQWMMAALDGELEARERELLHQAMEADPQLRAEWKRLSRAKEMMSMVEIRKPPDEIWTGYWHNVYNKIERGLGWILLSLGAIALGFFGFKEALSGLLSNPDLPFLVRAGILALGAGAVILIVSVIREKIFARRRDSFKEIER